MVLRCIGWWLGSTLVELYGESDRMKYGAVFPGVHFSRMIIPIRYLLCELLPAFTQLHALFNPLATLVFSSPGLQRHTLPHLTTIHKPQTVIDR